jgi:histidine triad (HIT) family protein
MDNCIFCKILSRELPAEIVYEDDTVVAFKDAYPVAPIHVLIVPKEHIPTLNDVSLKSGIMSHMAMVASEIAKKLGVAESGYRFVINVNKGGGQVIFHLHAHLMAGKNSVTRIIGVAVALSALTSRIKRFFKKESP